MRYLLNFMKFSGEDTIIEKHIPKRGPSSALVHKQAAIKFGKIHDFDMPFYRQLVKKLEIDTHVHVSNISIKLFLNPFLSLIVSI